LKISGERELSEVPIMFFMQHPNSNLQDHRTCRRVGPSLSYLVEVD
jgi:hypothetical protein